VGVSIAANRCCGIRCALGFDAGQVEKAREDDDVNCLALPADYIDLDKAISIVSSFIKTKFSGKEKYQHRVEKLDGSSGCCGGGCCGGGCGQC
jgi:ribose 5-phosphate isomerase B